MATNPESLLGLSDEDFLKQAPPETGESSSEAQTENQGDQNGQQGQQPQQEQQVQGEAQTGAEGTGEQEQQKPAGEGEGEGNGEDAKAGTEDKDGQGNQNGTEGEKKPDPSGSKTGAEGEQNQGGEAKPTDKDAKPAAEAPNFEELYKQITAPFMANGKKIEIKDPAEAIALMQMGANYTRKMQEMAPNRRLLAMLDNHQLLDEGKLSFFIALDKGDPEAIKKLLVDKGVDPLDIDTKIEPAYREGNYQVSDQQLAFSTQLEDLTSSDSGKQTLQVMDKWDQASKDMLWQHPEVMPIIHAQRENGIYDTIATEVDRRRTMGQLPLTTSFLEAYKTVGDELHAAGAFGKSDKGGEQGGAGQTGQGTGGQQSAERPAAAVVTTRTATPRPTVDNGDKAGAAAPSRQAPGQAKEVKNPLAMSDEDFMKAEGLRV